MCRETYRRSQRQAWGQKAGVSASSEFLLLLLVRTKSGGKRQQMAKRKWIKTCMGIWSVQSEEAR